MPAQFVHRHSSSCEGERIGTDLKNDRQSEKISFANPTEGFASFVNGD